MTRATGITSTGTARTPDGCSRFAQLGPPTAPRNPSPSANTVYQIGARWTGSNLELGATAYTLSVWVDRVKGTDAVAAAAMTETASAYLDFGSKAAAGTEQLNGQIRKIHVFQHVPSDEEMARQI